MLNKYIWQLYLDAGGEKTVKVFEDNFTKGMKKEYVDMITELHRIYHVSDSILDDERKQLNDLCKYLWVSYDSPFLLTDLYDRLINGSRTDSQAFDELSWSIAYFSTLFSYFCPDIYVPYYFKFNYNVLEMIAEAFGIELPKIPKKVDYKGRFFFYEDICHALHDFRRKNELTPYELYAFLYDFAPKYIGGVDSYIITDLPEPKAAYFIGGSKDDSFLENNEEHITPWQCNPETKAGDMIVMYIRTPISAIDSVWRSCSVGFNDPFFYYYRCTYISNPKSINRIGLNDMKKDDVLGKLPIVRKNMQGVNGVELKPSEYARILKLGKCKAQAIKYTSDISDNTFCTEKDVEEKIIKPLLKQLGYSETDYVQQLYIEIGNHNHALIPDFVLLPKKKQNGFAAFAVIEAKLSVTKEKELSEAKKQARSYAKLLNAKKISVISKEKIWIFGDKDDFEKCVFEHTIHDLTDDDISKIRNELTKR